MDGDSGESAEENEVAGVGRDESELEWLVRCGRRLAGSWFQRRGEAYWKERSVIRKEDDVDGRVRVTSVEVRNKYINEQTTKTKQQSNRIKINK